MESLSMLGDRRVGVVEVQEHNALRLRIANTWYFRASPGQWLTQECRRVRWEYTFYWDGRWVTQVRLDVSDESGPGAYRLSLPSEAAWSDGQRASSRIFSLAASDHREFLTAPDTPDRPAVEEAFLHPPRLSVSSPASRPSVSGAAEGTFDRAQGCFVVDGSAGLTRFTLGGGAPGVSSVIRLLRWPGTQAVINADGWSIRQYVRLGDQSLLFAVGQRPAGQSVEVSLPEGPVQQSHVAD